ncbi:MAG: hypothetical protein V4508_08230 [Pseudomonadota bacterium]
MNKQSTQMGRSLACLALGIAAVLADAHAGKVAKTVQVGVTVKSILSIGPVTQPATFVVTKDDIKAGFVTVPNGGSYTVTNNNRAGYKLSFRTSDFGVIGLKTVTVESGLASPVGLASNAMSYAPQPYRSFKITLNPGLRFDFLSKNDPGFKDANGNDKLKPGSYPWPVLAVGAEPL